MHLRLMLLGGGNALGQSLIRLGAEEDVDFYAPRPPLTGWDAGSLDQLFSSRRFDVLINLAYYYDWFQSGLADACCFDGQEAMVGHLARLCQQHGVILVEPSSYRVFDGSRITAYVEEDATIPLDVRGALLCRTEQLVREQVTRHVILRFGWLLDDSPEGILGRFLRRLELPEAVPLADDRRGNPTAVEDAARVMMAVLKQLDCQAELWGTYHYGGHEATTPMGVAQLLISEAAMFRAARAELLPVAHASCPDACTEPQYGVLSCRKLLHTFGIRPRAWRTGLSGLLLSYYSRD